MRDARNLRQCSAHLLMVTSVHTEARPAVRFQPSTLVALLVAGAFFMENLDGTVIATARLRWRRHFASAPSI